MKQGKRVIEILAGKVKPEFQPTSPLAKSHSLPE